MASSGYHLAQLNIATMKYPLDSPEMADFVNAIPEVNLAAERHPGYIWRLQDDDDSGYGYGGSTSQRLPGYDRATTLVNMSVWRDLASLQAYIRDPKHLAVMRRRREWFDKMASAHLVLWWLPVGHVPSLAEAAAKLKLLIGHGPSAAAFNFSKNFPAPGEIS